MKTYLKKILCVCILITSYSNICEGSTERANNQKIYLDPDMISLSSSCITIQWQNSTFISDSIFADEDGIFTLMSELWAWKCTHCKSTNPDTNDLCWQCHRDKPKK